MNPFMNVLVRLLGQAAMQQMLSGQGKGGFGSPFGDVHSHSGEAQPDDDSPIDVDAEVVGDDGKTQSQRARESWDASTASVRGNALQGKAPFAASNGYRTACYVLAVCILLAGVAFRIALLVAGNIASLVIAPAVAGFIFGIILGFVGVVVFYRLKQDRLPYRPCDIALLPGLGVLVGYPFLISVLISYLVAFAFMKTRNNGTRLPLMPLLVVLELLQLAIMLALGLIAS